MAETSEQKPEGAEASPPAKLTLTPAPPVVTDDSAFAALLDSARFNHLWRVATMFSKSDIVPSHYRGKAENCMIGIATAIRLQIDPLMFLQKTYIVHGKPGMEAQLAIALVNSRGGLRGKLKYRFIGQRGNDSYGCVAWGIDAQSGEQLDGPEVTIAIAKAEGWYGDDKGMKQNRDGGSSKSKWSTMTDLMLTYRAAAFFARVHCPDALLGFYTNEELDDFEPSEPKDVTPRPERIASPKTPSEIEAEMNARGKPERTVEELEQRAKDWLTERRPDRETQPEEKQAPTDRINDAQVKVVTDTLRAAGITGDVEVAEILKPHNCESPEQLTVAQFQKVLAEILKKGKKAKREPGGEG